MTVVSKVLSIPSLTLAAVLEAAVAIKFFPDYWGTKSHLHAVAFIVLINNAFGAVFWLLLYPRLFSPLRRIPGPRSYLSAAHRSFIVKDRPSGDLFLELAEQFPGEDMLTLNATRDQVAIMNPQLLADVLVHKCYDFTKPPRISAFLRYILGDGLIIVEGDPHKFLRKKTTPAFHFRHIKELYPMMWAKGETLTRTLGKDIATKSSSTIELNSWASKVTLDIIGVAGLGRDIDSVEKNKDPLAGIYEELLDPDREKLIFGMLCLALGRPLIAMLPWNMNNIFNHLIGSLESICRPMIQDKRVAINEKGDDHFDVLSLLMKSGDFSDEALKDQLLTFLAAGHETTASALTWACYLLTRHPDIQEKLREEVKGALPEVVEGMPAADLAGILEQLPYLNGIMHETLRLYPTVPITMRQAQRDTQVGDQFIPAGTDIIISIWYINRSPELWGSDAGLFRPERWITDDGKPNQSGGANSNYDYMTFLHGPRSCIGQNFAKAEMRCLLAAMVRSFTWELDMDDKLVMPRGVITIRPENGMYLKLKPLVSKAE
ncbi:cytochrome p450 domain-containing protein [Sarocladium implicatum]|nr:cytochrome p450 domain-containing protein [Sarocladium implicatum]